MAMKWQQPSTKGRTAQQEVLTARQHGGEGLSRVAQRQRSDERSELALDCPQPPCNPRLLVCCVRYPRSWAMNRRDIDSRTRRFHVVKQRCHSFPDFCRAMCRWLWWPYDPSRWHGFTGCRWNRNKFERWKRSRMSIVRTDIQLSFLCSSRIPRRCCNTVPVITECQWLQRCALL